MASNAEDTTFYENPDQDYNLRGKTVLSAIIILFFIFILVVCLHLYARWYLLRARRSQMLRARRRQMLRSRRLQVTHLIYVDPSDPAAARGLDDAVLKTLPVFVYSEKTHPETLECAVCLSEFEENESGRVLPKCKHSFHVECIDMWFHSHSSCPLCRSPVEPVPENPTQEIPTDEPGSSSGFCATCQEQGDDAEVGNSAGRRRRKAAEMIGVTTEVPSRALSFENESGAESPAIQQFRSPVSRMLSLKRILSWERRPPASPTSASCAESATLSDVERGRDETRETQS